MTSSDSMSTPQTVTVRLFQAQVSQRHRSLQRVEGNHWQIQEST
jgi:hypothetical protein